MIWILILLLGVVAGTVGGIVGFGSAVILMPMLVLQFGAKEAVPIIAIASICANASRAAVWWRDIAWRVNAVYCAAAIPFAVLGAHTMLALDARVVEGCLGGFLLFAIPARRWLRAQGFVMPLWAMAPLGAGIGFLAGLVATTGPINTPFFLAHGLSKGAFLGTEAVGSAVISITKIATFGTLGALNAATLTAGSIVGLSLMLGSWIAKHLVDRIDGRHYQVVLEAMMLIAGTTMLAAAVVGG
jgi:uncharacterized protein